jgi:hypothetical protein
MIMSYRVSLLVPTVLCLTLVGVCGGWTGAAAQDSQPESNGESTNSTLTVAVLPLQAEVRLDGALLGSAHDLVARALSMVPGDHVVEIAAPGYLPSVVNVAGFPNWASHVNLELVPDRRP